MCWTSCCCTARPTPSSSTPGPCKATKMASTQRIVRAAAVQIAPDFERPEGTLERVCGAIDEAAAKGVQMMVFPETFVPYYPYFSFVLPPVQQGPAQLRLYERAVGVPGPITAAVAAQA